MGVNVNNEKTAAAPVVAAWIAVGVAILLTLFLVRYSVVTIGEIREILAYNSLRENIAIANYYESEADLEELQTEIGPYRWFKTRSAKTEREENRNKTTLKDYHKVIRLLSQDDFKAALIAFNGLREGPLHSILETMPPNSQNTFLLSDIEDEFKTYHHSLARLKTLSNEIPELMASNESRIRSQSMLAGDLAHKFGALLSVMPEEEDLESGRIEFYSEGVLKDLPKLKGIPDNLVDLKALKTRLDLIGGKVELRGQNIHKVFRDKLEELKESSMTYKSTIDALQDENDKLESEFSGLKHEVANGGTVLETNLKAFFLEATRPEANATALFIADHVWGTRI